MTKLPFSVFISILTVFFTVPFSHALGSSAPLAVSYSSGAVCGLVSGQPTQRIVCYLRGQTINVEPNISFSSISGGRTSLCGLYALLCYDNLLSQNSTFVSKRVYFNEFGELENISVGENHICATVAGSGAVKCWRGDNRTFQLPSGSDQFGSISSGSGFSCGIIKNNSRVRCWGTSTSMAAEIENGFGETAMATIQAGGSHVCGVNITGSIICRGNNDSGQLNAPPGIYSGLALGDNHSCAIRISNQSVICWGGGGREFGSNVTAATSFQEVQGELGLPEILPGRCVQSSCSECGIYPQSQKLCYGSGNICNPYLQSILAPKDSPSGGLKTGLLVFCIVGSIGGFAGICTVIYCLWRGGCFGHKKVHNSVQPTITRGGCGSSNNGDMPNNSRSATIRRQGSRIMRRQRSGTSSNKHTERAEEFSLAELAAATNGFALENKIGAGSFGVVYRGKLDDGREVAIKRGETTTKMKKYQEKESAFDSELAFLSRLHHKHLVRLVGYCEEKEERLLVYEYMKNGALYDHLHDKNNVERSSSLINLWKMRIKVALDAAKGIEYLHNYAVPPIIHRDIKSSNILIDGNWTGRVSDFGLSLLGPEHDSDYRPMKAAGTVGYIDPEYYGLNLLTAKSDVYGLGVVLLELLTGKRAIFRNSEDGGTPTSVVDYTVPQIMAGELEKVLDPRVGPPEINEAEAVELVAYTAMHCVNLEGKDRPTMTDIVANLERALSLCEESPGGSISSGSIISAE
ncbi:hypothetical protein ACLB2K_074807 [Fragaria x ananassa]